MIGVVVQEALWSEKEWESLVFDRDSEGQLGTGVNFLEAGKIAQLRSALA